ncbi:hypothetical protein BCR35DRAFT_150718 [Leucosporidium creatinivorum]|uniref:Uncharacterized protein n=1 Tax=Leucosporidium creatinivorum TaxID=106004 RepID=A0A1Y2ENV9_9BASI|nr:hypothetical protein BCR35DRAFT_150718 [Leucosporidium creatinivorum]
MPALFARSKAKRQRLSEDSNLVERANDGFWTPGMGESTASTETPIRVINPKHVAATAEPTILTIESPTIVTLTPTVVVVTVTSLVEETPTATPSLAATLSTQDKLFGGASSSAVKIINVSDDATTSSALETESSSAITTDAPAPIPTASAILSDSSSEAALSTESPVDSASSAEAPPTETERVFGLPSQSQIAVVSTSAESVESPTSIATSATPTLALESASQVAALSSSTASSSEAIFSLDSSRIAVVASSSETPSASSVLSSIIGASGASSFATSLPLSSASSSSEKVFSLASSHIAVVSTGAAASSSLAAASSSRLAASSASAAASRSAAATAIDGASYTTSSLSSTYTSASRSDDAASSSGQTSTEQFFKSIGRSPISITITALVSVAILAVLVGIAAFFIRRCTRRRRRAAAGHRHLGSDGGSPRLGAGAWGEKDMEEKGREVDSDDETDESDVHPEAVWRRRVDRMNAQAAQRYPSLAPAAPIARTRAQVAVAPEMSPISEQMTSSDWTSFIGDGDWGDSVDGRSRMGSIDSNASTEPAILASFSTRGLDPNDRNPHPLRHSWVPSFGSFDSPSLKSLGSPSSQYSPDDEESLVAGLPPTPRSRNFSIEPPSPSTIKAPHSPSKTNLQQSLDRLVGSAAEYLGGFFSDDGHSKPEEDRYTSFKSPRKAPPTPIIIPPTPRAASLSLMSPPTYTAPAFPDRAATYAAPAPEEPTRPATSRGTNLSFLERSYSDGSQFLGVAHGHVARNLRGKLAIAAGKEKPYNSGKGVTSWSMEEEQAAKEACEQDSLLGGAGTSTVQDPNAEASIDPFDDSHAAPAPQSPPSPTPRAETPPSSSASQPLIPFLSPFGNPRSMNFPNADDDKDKDSNYWSDETTSTIKRPLSMGSTIRPSPKKERPLAPTLVTRRFSTKSGSSSSSSSSDNNDDEGKRTPTASQLQRSFSDSQIAASSSTSRPRPVSMASLGTFGSRDSDEDGLTSTESGGSDESDSSRAKRERMRRIEEQERTRRLMAERRRRSSGEIIKRV